MIVWPPPERPVILAVACCNRQIVDARDADPHQALLVKLPVLVSVGTVVLTTVVMPLVGKAHRDTTARECPHFLDEPVVELASPFACQECNDFTPSVQKLSAIAPAAVFRVRERDGLRIAR